MAQFLEWTEELSVGIEEIDGQHKILVDLINQMYDAIHQRRGSKVTGDILKQLKNYTVIHFAVEESLMRILHYPDYEEHKAHHQKLIDQVVDLQKKFESGEHSISFELMHFLRLWLLKHIMEEDKRYESHFINEGIKPELPKRNWFQRVLHTFD